MNHSPILHTEELKSGYGRRVVVQDVTLTAWPGQMLSLIGPNGSGKTTLLKTLLKELMPLGGRVLLLGQDMQELKPRERARRIAAVLTDRPQPELMTCREVVALGRYPFTGQLGILSPADEAAVEESMALAGIKELEEHLFQRISDGQRQRVLLARAICQEPEVLLLDEPTSFLDIRYKLEFMHRLRALMLVRRMAVIISLHELDLAQKFSDQVICLKDGRIDRSGAPEEIFSGHYIEELYGLKEGSYYAPLSLMEPQRTKGGPQVLVIGGGGSGLPVYRWLWRQQIPFAAGVLPENDVEIPVARALAAEVIAERLFEPVSEAALAKAKTVLDACQWVICATECFGTINRGNEELVKAAREQEKLVTLQDLRKR